MIYKSKDPNFWSIRVNRDLRIIVHKTASSFLLCYVDHHDKAYDWAVRRRIEAHPRTGAIQIVEVRERVVAPPAGSALVRESAGAALVVLGSRTHGRLRRGLFESVESVLGSVRSPVAVGRNASCYRLENARGSTRDSHWLNRMPNG